MLEKISPWWIFMIYSLLSSMPGNLASSINSYWQCFGESQKWPFNCKIHRTSVQRLPSSTSLQHGALLTRLFHFLWLPIISWPLFPAPLPWPTTKILVSSASRATSFLVPKAHLQLWLPSELPAHVAKVLPCRQVNYKCQKLTTSSKAVPFP